MLRTPRDVFQAIEAGRTHTQRFYKAAGLSGDARWIDWSFASGQPAYDARIGDALTFTPCVAQKNDAIWFPDIPAGMQRQILEMDIVTIPSSTGQMNVEFQMFDLIGYYPLIDGDSTDPQVLDNTLPLPRFADGEGVFPILVNHVAPAVSVADAVVTYTNSKGAQQTVTWRCTLTGAGTAAYTVSGSGTAGPLYAALAAGDSGVSRIDEVVFTTAPGGLWAIYLAKPLCRFANRGGQPSIAATATMERNFLMQNGGNMPTVADGAWLGFFYMTNGNARAAGLHGNLQFVWG